MASVIVFNYWTYVCRYVIDGLQSLVSRVCNEYITKVYKPNTNLPFCKKLVVSR